MQLATTSKDMSSHTSAYLFFKYLFTIIIAFLLPIKGIMLAVGFSILADTIIGLYRAKKQNQQITSRRLSNIVSKMFLYQGAVVLFFIIEKFILGDIVSLFVTASEFIITKLIAMALIGIELKSINENYESATGISVWSKIKEVLTRAKEIKDDLKGSGE